MSPTEIMRDAARQTRFAARLIEEAENCGDRGRAALLLGMAREETANMSANLRQYLARRLPAHRLAERAVA